MRHALVLYLLAAVLTGCGSDITISQGQVGQRSSAGGHADYAAALGPLPVVMAKNPFPPPAVLAALQSNNPRPLRFTTEPPASVSGGYRLLLAFDQHPPGGLEVCRAPLATSARPAASGATTLRVYGAFCLGPVLISDAVASSTQAMSADDPRLGRLMGDLLSALMPFRPPPGGESR